MQLFVHLDGASGGRSVVIDAKRSDTWDNVKLQIRSTGRIQGITNEQLYLASSSRVLDDSCLVTDSEVTDGSNVQCCIRMSGGGGDGGSTGAESREAYLEMYKQKTAGALDPREERLAAYQRCKLSGDQLRPPIVADELGTLFNKEAVLKALVNKSMPAYLSHISGMKHVVELQLERNPNFGAEGSSVVKQGAAASGPTNEAEFQCPITGLQFNSKFKFLAHERSGHVFSEKALKEAKPVVEEAMGAPVKADEWIILCGNEHDRERMQARMLERRAAIKSKKKGKKSGKRAAGADLEAGDAKGRLGAKKLKDTAELAPEWADRKLWKSLFTSSKPASESGQATETFLCRSTMARGMNLT